MSNEQFSLLKHNLLRCFLPSVEINWWGGQIVPHHENIQFGITFTDFLEVILF